MSEFVLTPHGNETLDGDGFYISFRASPAPEAALFNEVLGPLVGINDRAEGAGSETALYTDDDDGWRILNGDFRAEYAEAFPDLLACIAVYDRHKADHRSGWSNDDE